MTTKQIVEKRKIESYYKESLLKMELFLQTLSEKIHEALLIRSKSMKQLFYVYSKTMLGYVNFEEFTAMINNLLKFDVEPNLVAAVFKIFNNQCTKRISYSLFEYLLSFGKKINKIYLKLKYQFGNSKNHKYFSLYRKKKKKKSI